MQGYDPQEFRQLAERYSQMHGASAFGGIKLQVSLEDVEAEGRLLTERDSLPEG